MTALGNMIAQVLGSDTSWHRVSNGPLLLHCGEDVSPLQSHVLLLGGDFTSSALHGSTMLHVAHTARLQ